MGEGSPIQWTDHTFNPWIGCTKVSPGCANCYAERERFVTVQRGQGRELWGDRGERHITSRDYWAEPRRWNRAAEKAGRRERVFCASLSDVFEDRPELAEPRARLAKLIRETPHLDWLLLTKRPENARRLWSHAWIDSWNGADSFGFEWPPNIWLGVTAEDQEHLAKRVPYLLDVPARVRFISAEPLLGPLDLSGALSVPDGLDADPLAACLLQEAIRDGRGDSIRKISWVIVGGESGNERRVRPFELEWARSIIRQCRAAGVAVFCKQLGAHPLDVANPRAPAERGRSLALAHPKGGDPAEWPDDLRVREFPEVRR